MKVCILIQQSEDGRGGFYEDIRGVFSSLEKAEDRRDYLVHMFNYFREDFEVREVELDENY